MQFSHAARQPVQPRLRILICGDRNWTDPDLIGRMLDDVWVSCVIQGECRGADVMARDEAKKRGLPVLSFPAKWDTYGGAAGPIRNQQMIDEGRPDIVWAFHDDIENSAGTRDMIRTAQRANVLIKLISHRTGGGFVITSFPVVGFRL